ncbi:MAG: hypothetical protein M0Z66_07930 [Thermaerobacter sp.]|nr:hypothetical protein [Thermaerobacter sp.]
MSTVKESLYGRRRELAGPCLPFAIFRRPIRSTPPATAAHGTVLLLLLVEGTRQQRAEQAAAFYDLAGAASEEIVRPGTIAALAEAQSGITMAAAAGVLAAVLQALPGA